MSNVEHRYNMSRLERLFSVQSHHHHHGMHNKRLYIPTCNEFYSTAGGLYSLLALRIPAIVRINSSPGVIRNI